MDLNKKKVTLLRQCDTIDSNYKYLLCNKRFPQELERSRKTIQELAKENKGLRRTIEEQRSQINTLASSEENKDVFYFGRDTVEDELRELYLITGVRSNRKM